MLECYRNFLALLMSVELLFSIDKNAGKLYKLFVYAYSRGKRKEFYAVEIF